MSGRVLTKTSADQLREIESIAQRLDPEGWVSVVRYWPRRKDREQAIGVLISRAQNYEPVAVVEGIIEVVGKKFADAAIYAKSVPIEHQKTEGLCNTEPKNVGLCNITQLTETAALCCATVFSSSTVFNGIQRSSTRARRSASPQDENAEGNGNDRSAENDAARNEMLAELVRRPFDEFFRIAVFIAHRQAGEESRGPLFTFAWLLRGHAEMEPHLLRPVAALDRVEVQLKQMRDDWEARKEPTFFPHHGRDHWGVWFDLPKNEARILFDELWRKLRYRPGHGPLEQAIAAARQFRLVPAASVLANRPPEDPEDKFRGYTFFISVAGHLQAIVGDRAILLPCRKLGELFGVSGQTISRYSRMAIEDGYLVLARGHTRGSRAAEYRFDVSRFTELTKRAQDGALESFKEIKERAR